jgi:hypothetical protein
MLELTLAAAWVWQLMEDERRFAERQLMIAEDDGMFHVKPCR